MIGYVRAIAWIANNHPKPRDFLIRILGIAREIAIKEGADLIDG